MRDFEKETGNLEEAFRKAVIYCRDHEILKEFLINNATEVMNMLMTEWNWDDALAYRYEEGREEGREEVARNAIAQGVSLDIIQKITGLDIQTITSFTN